MKNKLFPHLIGPLVTFGITVLIEAFSRLEWYVPSLALAFIGLAVSAIYGGLWSSLASATIIVAYGMVELDFDVARIVQTAIAAYSIAIVNGVDRRLLVQWILKAEENQAKADAYDTLNGNIDTLKKLARRISDLTNGWELLNDKARMGILEEVQGGLVNLAQRVVGWHEIAKEKKSLEEE